MRILAHSLLSWTALGCISCTSRQVDDRIGDFDPKKLSCVKKLEPSGAVSFSPDGSRLFVLSPRGELRALSTTGWKEELLPWKAGGSPLAASPDGRRLAIGHGDHVVVFDLEALKEDRRLDLPKGDMNCVVDLAWSPEGRRIAVVSDGDAAGPGEDRLIRIWEIASGKQQNPLRNDHRALALHWGKSLAAATARGVCGWDAETGRRTAECGLAEAFSGFPGVAGTSDGRFLAACTTTMHLWQFDPRKEVVTEKLPAEDEGRRFVFFLAKDRYVMAVAGRIVRFWSVPDGKAAGGFSLGSPAWAVAAAPEGRWIAFATTGRIEIWGVAKE